MIIYKNKILPFKGYKIFNFFGILFTREDAKNLSKQDLNHESIHCAQMKELLYIGFYIWYMLEYIFKFFTMYSVYRNISFEVEAYENERDLNYLDNRKHYNWIQYI